MWAIYALLSALFVATSDPIAKKVLKNGVDEYIVGWAMIMFSTPFLAFLCLQHGFAPINGGLIKALAVAVPLEIAAAILYYKALKLTDISLSVPFLALTPIFVCLTGFVFLGERVRPTGIVGIILITVGAYSLNIKSVRSGILHPLKAIFSNKGSLCMAIVALIFSVSSVMSKKAMLSATPESIPFIYNFSIGIAMLPIILFRTVLTVKEKTVYSTNLFFVFCLLGLLTACSIVCFFRSVALTNVAYTVSIKRISLLMSVGYGWLFFREQDVHIRLASTLCMVIGVALVAISS